MTQLRVLIPLDGSKLAEAPLAHLSGLRAMGEIDLHLVSVVDQDEDFQELAGEEAIKREHNVLGSYLRDVAGDLKKHLGLPSETHVVRGSPAQCILDVIEDVRPDLVLISTHGRSGFSRWRLGSVADKIVRASICNVMVLGPRAAEAAAWYAEISPPFASILAPLDGSELAEQALPVAQRFAECYESTLHLVRIVPVPVYGDVHSGIAYPEILTDLENAARAYMAPLAQQTGLGERCKVTVKIGAAATELLNYVDENKVDLVVMTTHGRGGIKRAALGSVTDRMLESSAPVLVVKPDAR